MEQQAKTASVTASKLAPRRSDVLWIAASCSSRVNMSPRRLQQLLAGSVQGVSATAFTVAAWIHHCCGYLEILLCQPRLA
jgi:hypothetical protein